MSDVETSPRPPPSHPLAARSSPRQLAGTLDDDSLAQDAFIQHLVVKQPHYTSRNSRKSNPNYAPSVGSVVERTPSSLFELKQQRLLAAADRKKRIIARIVSIVGLLIILLCAAIVTLTLKMAPKIDELVRTKAGPHQLIHFVSRMTTPTTTTATTTTMPLTMRPDNQTINGSVIEKSLFRTRRKPLL